MNPVSLQKIADLTAGSILTGNPGLKISGAATDSRTVQSGDLFFALNGERSDGHDFVAQAFEKGAAAAVVGRPLPCPADKGLVLVADPLKALGDLASGYRQRFSIMVIGLTGSVGKTTAKEMTASVLGSRFSVLKNEGNLNTEIGLPLTLLEMNNRHEVAVLEMAMRGPGEIARLAEIASPRIGAITNIGISHIERLGSPEAIAQAKAELLERLPPDGIAVLNADDAFFGYLRSRFSGRVLSFGQSHKADISAEGIRSVGIGKERPGLSFRLKTPDGETEAFLPALGRYNIPNALLAAATGAALGIVPGEIAEGLSHFRNAPMRMEAIRLKEGGLLLNDAYNASPASMQAALDTLAEMEGSPRIAALGDMMELGDESQSAHRSVGRMAAASKLNWLATVGERARAIAEEAIASGMPPERVVSCTSHEEAAAFLRQHLTPGAITLIKGSRAIAMERVIDKL